MSDEWMVVSLIVNVVVLGLAYWLGYHEGAYQERRRYLRALNNSQHWN